MYSARYELKCPSKCIVLTSLLKRFRNDQNFNPSFESRDLGGDISSISEDWEVRAGTTIVKEDDIGMLIPIVDGDVKIGDFVDVLITPDIIVTNGNNKSANVGVRYNMERIVVLNHKPSYTVGSSIYYLN